MILANISVIIVYHFLCARENDLIGLLRLIWLSLLFIVRFLSVSAIVLASGRSFSTIRLAISALALVELGSQLGLPLVLALHDSTLLLGLFLELGQIVLVGLSLSILVQLGHHLVVIALLGLLFLLYKVLLDDSH